MDRAEGNNPYSVDELDGVDEDQLELEREERVRIQRLFCGYLAAGRTVDGSVKLMRSVDQVETTRKTMYKWRRRDAVFKQAWNEAYAAGSDKLEDKAMDLALVENNSSCLQFLLRIRNPDRYAINRVEVGGFNGEPIKYGEVRRTIVDAVTGEVTEQPEE